LYHVGKGNVRVSKSTGGSFHLDNCILTSPAGKEIVLEAEDFFHGWQRANFQQYGEVVFDPSIVPLEFKVDIAEPGEYNLKLKLNAQDQDAQMNVCVNGEHLGYRKLPRTGVLPKDDYTVVDFGMVKLPEGANTISVDIGPARAEWSDGTKALWSTPALHKGFKVWRDDVVFAYDYDRMWPDTWSGQKKIYFYSWDGSSGAWKLPEGWSDVRAAKLYPLTPDGRGEAVQLTITDRNAAPSLLPQVPYVLVPMND
jgi:hypothetical protein